MYSLKKPPVPFNEEDADDVFWEKDEIEESLNIPPGFITDWLYYLRGTEIPTVYTMWTALGMMSALLKRDVWYQWQDSFLYPNLYILLIGPPGMKKSASITKGLDLLGENADSDESELSITKTMLGNPVMYHMKKMNILQDKATPEFLLDCMTPGAFASALNNPVNGKPLITKEGTEIKYRRDSEIFICAQELTALINKKKYNETMIEILTDIYDTKKVHHCGTKGEGKKVLRNLHTTFLAATTPASFKESIPMVAASDGFLSRCIFVYLEDTKRCFPFPVMVPGAPSLQELRERLAWIACYTEGTHSLSFDAQAAYNRWYERVSSQLAANSEAKKYKVRITQHVLKVALLLKAQRYDPGKVISLDDFKLAKRLVVETYHSMGRALSEMNLSKYDKGTKRVMNVIKKHREIQRGELLRQCKVPAKEFTEIMEYFIQTGEVKVFMNGQETDVQRCKTHEKYVYAGDIGEDDGTE